MTTKPTILTRLKRWFHACTADTITNMAEVSYGVVDVSYSCQCGKAWTTTWRTREPDVADWFIGVARNFKEKRLTELRRVRK